MPLKKSRFQKTQLSPNVYFLNNSTFIPMPKNAFSHSRGDKLFHPPPANYSVAVRIQWRPTKTANGTSSFSKIKQKAEELEFRPFLKTAKTFSA